MYPSLQTNNGDDIPEAKDNNYYFPLYHKLQVSTCCCLLCSHGLSTSAFAQSSVKPHYLELGYLEHSTISNSYHFPLPLFFSHLLTVILNSPLSQTDFHFPWEFEIAGFDCTIYTCTCILRWFLTKEILLLLVSHKLCLLLHVAVVVVVDN